MGLVAERSIDGSPHGVKEACAGQVGAGLTGARPMVRIGLNVAREPGI